MLIRQTVNNLSLKPNASKSNNNKKKSKTSGAAFIKPQAALGCREQPADSQIRSDRERRCSRRTPGPPPASLLSSQSPSSPRRRSSEGGGGEERQRRRAGWKEEGEACTTEESPLTKRKTRDFMFSLISLKKCSFLKHSHEKETILVLSFYVLSLLFKL